MIGAGLAGPRRIKAGGARDHLLGAHAVSGFGDSFKAGGKVVKNVTGYDLCKLLAGSWGTLAVMTEVTLKVMPRPESERTLLLRGLDDIKANRAMTAALGSPFDVSGAAHVPSSLFPQRGWRTGRPRRSAPGGDVCCGSRASPPRRPIAPRHLANFSRRLGRRTILEDAASAAVWSSVRDIEPFAARRPRSAPGRCGGSYARRPRAARSVRSYRATNRRRRDLRLGRRPDLGGAASQARRPGGPAACPRRRGSEVMPCCCADPSKCAAMSMCFIPSKAALLP